MFDGEEFERIEEFVVEEGRLLVIIYGNQVYYYFVYFYDIYFERSLNWKKIIYFFIQIFGRVVNIVVFLLDKIYCNL